MHRFLMTISALTVAAGLWAQVKVAKPEDHGMDPERLARVDAVIDDAVGAGNIPGAVLAVVRRNDIVYLKAYGNKSVVPEVVPMTTDTMFDLASLSKCVGTTLSFMQLIEGGYVRLTDPVKRYIPGFKPWKDPETGEEVDIISLVNVIATEVERHFRPGSDFLYSCLNFITLQHILETVTGERLCDYAESHVFAPLGLKHTCYFPLQEDLRTPSRHQELLPLVAPTEVQSDGSVLKGAVHDPLARLANGGNSGNAGVFSDAVDLSRICMMIMNQGRALQDKKLGFSGADTRILSRAAVRLMTTIPSQNAPSVGRALGWDVKSEHGGLRGDLFNPETTLMHTGYTGTSLVIDLDTQTAVVLLTNRVHPTDDGSVSRLRALVSNIVAGSILY